MVQILWPSRTFGLVVKNVQPIIMKNSTWKSSAFNAAIEQATIIRTGRKVDYPPTGLTGKPINMRSNKTFTSTIFNPLVHKLQISQTSQNPLSQTPEKTSAVPLKSKTPEPPLKPESKLKQITNQVPKSTKSLKKIEKISDILQKSSYLKQIHFQSTDSGSKTEIQSPRGKSPEKPAVSTEGEVKRSSTPDLSIRSVSPSTSVSFELSAQSEIDPDVLRQFFRGHQVISMDSPFNPVTGRLSKSTKVTLKSSEDLSELVQQLEAKGFQVRQTFSTLGRKSDLRFASQSNLIYSSPERVRSSTPHHLESSDDLFGSSPGVGRSRSGARTPDRSAEVLYAWDSLRFPREEKFYPQKMRSERSYMKSTVSSNSKSKKLIEYLY